MWFPRKAESWGRVPRRGVAGEGQHELRHVPGGAAMAGRPMIGSSGWARWSQVSCSGSAGRPTRLLLEEDGADESGDGGLVGKNADDLGAALDLKGLVAGTVNLMLALAGGAHLPPAGALLAAGTIGFLGYGVSLTLFVLGLRHLGTARTGAYFSLAPFIGATLAVLMLEDALSAKLLVAGCLMGLGLWLHFSERHEHEHVHEAIGHEHRHRHDEHHRHEHEPSMPPGEPHTHWHQHAPLAHRHPHYPDLHHRHGHQSTH